MTSPTWSAARLRLAGLALLLATLTAAGAATLGGIDSLGRLAIAYVAVVAIALRVPGLIVAQVLGGQALAAAVLPGAGRADSLLIVPLIAGVVATAELLASVARLDAPLRRPSPIDLRRPVFATLLAAAVFAIVLLARRLPGPGGSQAVALAAAACVILALLLASDVRRTTGDGQP